MITSFQETTADYGSGTCVVCSAPYQKIIKNQVTCGDFDCRQERNRLRVRAHTKAHPKGKAADKRTGHQSNDGVVYYYNP